MQARRSVLLKVPATFAYRELTCRTVAAVAKLCLGMKEPLGGEAARRFTNELVSAVGEAFNNVVMHAYAGSDGGTIELELEWTADHVVLEMRDTGEAFDLEAVPDLDLETAHENGMGVHIIRSFVDEVEYRPGAPNVLVLKKRVAPQGGETKRRQAAGRGDRS